MATDAIKLAAEQFNADGFSIIRGFATPEEVASMKDEIAKLIEKWEMNESRGSIFSTDPDEKHISNDYFVGSAETVRFFFEPDAIDARTGAIRTDLPKERLINKMGHNLHVLNPVFQKYSFSDKVKSLVAALGYKDPVLPQSMYIFKQPGIGGAVTSHQDSTFLHTEPRQTCLGLWLALDNADISNGCLWVRPGSHRCCQVVVRVLRNSTCFVAVDVTP
jgi:phytanoyl-CoA hydroxylase